MQAISNVFPSQHKANKLRKPERQILSVRWHVPKIVNLTTCFMVSTGNLGRKAHRVKQCILSFPVWLTVIDTKIVFA